jgi:cyclic beta-1,2-glucan synthetase
MRGAGYIAANLVGTAVTWGALVLEVAPRLDGHALLLMVPLFVLAPHLVRGTIDTLVQSRIGKRTDVARASMAGVSERCRTLVAIPALLADEADVREAIRTLEGNYVANRGPFVHFALLTDFADAPQAHVDGDERLSSQLTSGMDALRQRQSADAEALLVLHRHRRWNARERTYMGWERKRGKLVQLNRAIAGGTGDDYVLKSAERELLKSVRYVVSLDSDAVLEPGGLEQLIAILEHPSNRWAGIVQPRLVRKLRRSQSLWSYMRYGPFWFTGRLARNMNMELFGKTRYTGKGLYDPQALERSGAADVPDNTLLSHDLIEGAHAGVITASDVILYQDVPSNFVSYLRRLHRWTRADIQRIAWMLPWVRRSNGRLARNSLSFVDRYWIGWLALDGFLVPACTAAVTFAWFVPLATAHVLYSAVAIVLCGPTLLLLAIRCVQAAFGKFRGVGLVGLLRRHSQVALTTAILTVAFMPVMTAVLVDAIARASVRMLITRRRIIEWATAAQTEQRSDSVAALVGAFAKGVAVATGTAILALIRTGPRPSTVAISALWAMSPVVAYVLGRIQVPGPLPVSPAAHGVSARTAPRGSTLSPPAAASSRGSAPPRISVSARVVSSGGALSAPAPSSADKNASASETASARRHEEPRPPPTRPFRDAMTDDVLLQMCAAYGVEATANRDEMRERLRAAMMEDDAQPGALSAPTPKS